MGFDDEQNGPRVLFAQIANGVIRVWDKETKEAVEHTSYTGIVAGVQNIYLDQRKTQFPGFRLRILMYDPKEPDVLVRLEITTYGQGTIPTTAASMLVRTLALAENQIGPGTLVRLRTKTTRNPETHDDTKGTNVFVSRIPGETTIPPKPKDKVEESMIFTHSLAQLERIFPYPDLRTGWMPDPDEYDQTGMEPDYDQRPAAEYPPDDLPEFLQDIANGAPPPAGAHADGGRAPRPSTGFGSGDGAPGEQMDMMPDTMPDGTAPDSNRAPDDDMPF